MISSPFRCRGTTNRSDSSACESLRCNGLDLQDRHQQPSDTMNSLNRYADPVYCMMRLIVGLMLACHGGQLVLGMFGGMPGSEKMITQVGGWLPLIGGFLISFGLPIRPGAFIFSRMFPVACFMFHVAS